MKLSSGGTIREHLPIGCVYSITYSSPSYRTEDIYEANLTGLFWDVIAADAISGHHKAENAL